MTITINNVGVSPDNTGIVKIVNYTAANGANLTVSVPTTNANTFIPLNQITNNVIISWINSMNT
jgi:phosphotransferase system HPr-like phosphotransfer protein